MSSMKVHHSLDELASDMRIITRKVGPEMRRIVRRGTTIGNGIARDHARRTARTHGKLYPRAFTTETRSFAGFGGGSYVGVYGPDASRKQGNMSFEGGSRNQPPHGDLRYSADVMGPAIARETRTMAAGLFWPGSDK